MNTSQLRAVLVLLIGMGAFGCGWLICHTALAVAPLDAVDEQTIRDLIKELGDDSFDKREAAEKRLKTIGEPALELLRKAAHEALDAEIRLRAEGLVRIIESSRFSLVQRLDGHIAGNWPWATRLALTPDGKRAVSAGFDGLRVWDLATGKQILVFGESKNGYWSVAVSGDGRRVIAGNNDRTAYVYELKTGKLVQALTGHTGEIWGGVLSADGKLAVSGAWDQSLRVWDVESGKQVRAFEGVRGHVRCLALSPDGKFVAAGHFDNLNGPGVVRLWDMEKGKATLRRFPASPSPQMARRCCRAASTRRSGSGKWPVAKS